MTMMSPPRPSSSHSCLLAAQGAGFKVVTGGTDNHLVLWDARPTGVSGAKLEKLLEMCSISVNKVRPRST